MRRRGVAGEEACRQTCRQAGWLAGVVFTTAVAKMRGQRQTHLCKCLHPQFDTALHALDRLGAQVVRRRHLKRAPAGHHCGEASGHSGTGAWRAAVGTGTQLAAAASGLHRSSAALQQPCDAQLP